MQGFAVFHLSAGFRRYHITSFNEFIVLIFLCIIAGFLRMYLIHARDWSERKADLLIGGILLAAGGICLILFIIVYSGSGTSG